MILSLCENIETLSVLRLVKIAITIIKICVPILLIATAMFNYAKTIINGELDKSIKSFVNQIIAAIAIFLIPTALNLILTLVWPDSEVSQCLKNATSENITKLSVDRTNNLIDTLENDISEYNYNNAMRAANKISDSYEKENMIEKIESYKEYIDILNEINSLSKKFDRTKYNSLYNKIENIENEKIRTPLLEKIESVHGKLLNVGKGVYTSVSGDLGYNVYVPNDATEKMPLILYLHGDGGGENTLYYLVKNIYGDDFPFIIVSPIGGNDPQWVEKTGRISVIKSITDKVCSEYSCDTSRISVAGHSRGAIGAWGMVNVYSSYFYSAVPVSCGASITASNFKYTKVMAFCGNQGDDINYYYDRMNSNVNAIKAIGGNAKFVELNADHGGTPALAFTRSTLEWMIN